MVGDTGSHLITRGYTGSESGGVLPFNSLFSYAIGAQESEIDTASYRSGDSGSRGLSAQLLREIRTAEMTARGKRVSVPRATSPHL